LNDADMVAWFDAVSKGVTRLDSAEDKKQVWCPHVRTWGLSEANLLSKKVLVTLLWPFGAQGITASFAPLVTPLAVRLFILFLVLWML